MGRDFRLLLRAGDRLGGGFGRFFGLFLPPGLFLSLGRGGALFSVVVDVESGSLELNGWRGDQFPERPSAVRAFLAGGIGNLLDPFDPLPAFLAGIFINRHRRILRDEI